DVCSSDLSATGDDQVGAAVYVLAAMVGGEPLHAAIACAYMAHAHLANAVRDRLHQILFEHQAFTAEGIVAKGLEPRIERPFVVNDELAQPADSAWMFDANAAQRKQPHTGGSRIARRESGGAWEHHVAYTVRELRRPSIGRA